MTEFELAKTFLKTEHSRSLVCVINMNICDDVYICMPTVKNKRTTKKNGKKIV